MNETMKRILIERAEAEGLKVKDSGIPLRNREEGPDQLDSAWLEVIRDLRIPPPLWGETSCYYEVFARAAAKDGKASPETLRTLESEAKARISALPTW